MLFYYVFGWRAALLVQAFGQRRFSGGIPSIKRPLQRLFNPLEARDK